MEITLLVAKELAALKAARGISTLDLAERTGISRANVVRYLNGERAIPMDSFMELCQALGAEPPDVLAAALAAG